MIKEIKLPEIADNVDSATVISVLVSEGDTIAKDDTIAEMESDKAAFDLPSDVAGTVKEIKVKDGDEVKVGEVVITVETDKAENGKASSSNDAADKKEKSPEKKDDESNADKGEPEKDEDEKVEEEDQKNDETEEEDEKNEVKSEEKASSKDEEEKDKPDDDDDTGKKGKHAGEDESEDEDGDKEEKNNEEADKTNAGTSDEESGETAVDKKEVAASPSVRRLARELGVDVHRVEGTGPYDRITAHDVKAYAKAIVVQSADQAAVSDDYELPDFSKYGETERKPMGTVRKKTAENMVASWQSIPHVFQFDKADITSLEAFRKQNAKKVEKAGGKLTVTAILLKVTAKALEAFPKFNASLDFKNREVVYKKYINIGVAVDTDRGLLVPVVRDANKKTISELAVELGELADKARNKKIMPDALQGGNLAISNLGGIGGTNFTPIVYRPNVAILGVSRSSEEAVFSDGEFKPRTMLPLSLSYDHRLIDGAEAARFLRWICEALENPFITML